MIEKPTPTLQEQSSFNLDFATPGENAEAAGQSDVKETPCFAADPLSLPAAVIKIPTASPQKIVIGNPVASIDNGLEIKNAENITIP